MNKSQQQRYLAEQMEKASRDAAKLELLWKKHDSGLEEEEEDKIYENRHQVPPPEPKDNSKYNPNKLVDIETFISHPYYLNFRPYPWQILALKLYYLNTEGNTNLQLNNALKEEEKGCDKCVWKKVLDNETQCVKLIEKEEPYQTFLDPLNSRCLNCSRCPLKIRQTRLQHEIQITADKQVEKELEEILENDSQDMFQSEMDMIEEIPDEAVREQIKRKIENNVKFQELVLIIGRRGTKSFLAVAIALYELYKILSLPNPQKQLRLPNFQEIHILNVAKNEDQAKDSIYTPMKNSAATSPFFQRYLDEPNELEMRFYTEYDLSENERRAKKGMAPINGTIIAKCGSSSAGGLVGKTCFIIILDELAAMAGDKPDSGVDKKLYDELVPSLATFGKNGKIICLSNPKGPFGQLYYLYENRMEDPTALIIKLPTEMSNANINKKWLMEQKRKDPIEYNMQFGAEFGNNSANPFFLPEDISDAFSNYVNLTRVEEREQNIEYYCHVDPAKTSDYYALAVVHAVPTGERNKDGFLIKRFVVDHIQFWAPVQLQQAVPLETVEKYIINLHQKFRFKQISFDQWHSSEIVTKLQNQGYPVIIKQFNKDYKDKIYIHLLDIFRTKRINFYKLSSGQIIDKNKKVKDINEIPEAKDQFMFLQKKWSSTGRQIIGALPGYHDDICDAIAAAVYECDTEQVAIKSLPKTRVVYTGRAFA